MPLLNVAYAEATLCDTLVRNMEERLLSGAREAAHRGNFDGELGAIHAAAVEKFASMEWPQQSEEEWRRTSVRNIDFAQFIPHTASATVTHVPLAQREHVDVYHAMEDIRARLPDERRALLYDMIRTRVERADNRFILWPYLFFSDIVVIDVRQKDTPNEPIVVTTEIADAECAVSPLVCVLSARHTRVEIFHAIRSTSDACHLCVNDSIALVAEEAHVQVVQMHDLNINSYHFSNGAALLERDSQLRHGIISLGGLLTKIRYDAHLNGRGAEAFLDGVYLGYEDQHCDLRTLQVHGAPSTNSFALYRGVIMDEAHTIYQGLIRVAKEATGTDAYLTNNNLLLSDEARADSIPSLNISTDEVKCSHGSTTGKIDRLQLFYLQSRGLSEREACAMLIQAFVDEVIQKFPKAGSERFRTAVGDRVANM